MQTWVFFKWVHINLPFSNWEKEYKRMRMKKKKGFITEIHTQWQIALLNLRKHFGIFGDRGKPLLVQNEPAAGEQCGKIVFLWRIRSLKVQFPVKGMVSLTHSLASQVAGLFLLCNYTSVSCFKTHTETGCIFFVVSL